MGFCIKVKKKQNLSKIFKSKGYGCCKILRNELKTMISQNKHTHCRNYFQDHLKNSKKTLTKMNEVLSNCKYIQKDIYLSEKGIILAY